MYGAFPNQICGSALITLISATGQGCTSSETGLGCTISETGLGCTSSETRLGCSRNAVAVVWRSIS